MPRKPLLQDLILDAIRAEPDVLPETLAAKLGTTKKSVQTVAGMWRQRKMLPPKPSRAVQQTTIPDTRLDAALAAEEACGAFLADVADVLGLADPTGVDMADVLAAVKVATAELAAVKVATAELGAMLFYDDEGTTMADIIGATGATVARLAKLERFSEECQTFHSELADVVGVISPLSIDVVGVINPLRIDVFETDVLAAVKVTTAQITASRAECEGLRAELRQVDAALGPAFGLRSARIVQLRSDSAQNAQLRSELHAAHAELRQAAHLTESDLESRIDLWQDAARLAVQAETLREQQQGTLLCGVVLSGEELRQLATLRDAEATALRVRALRGQT